MRSVAIYQSCTLTTWDRRTPHAMHGHMGITLDEDSAKPEAKKFMLYSTERVMEPVVLAGMYLNNSESYQETEAHYSEISTNRGWSL